MSIAIFYGTTTGHTEEAAEMISQELGELVSHMGDIANAQPSDLLNYNVLMFGVPTWNVGELQYDWEDFLPRLAGLDLTGKKIALFGLGDAYGYADNFLDALGLLWDEVKDLGAPELVGTWPTEGYTYDESKGQYDADHFLGLGLDDENESELHDARIKAWTAQLRDELGLNAAAN